MSGAPDAANIRTLTPESRRRGFAGSILAIILGCAVAGIVVLAAFSAPVSQRCRPAGEAVLPGEKVCTVSQPSPTTLIASGTVYTLPPAGLSYFQFSLSPASSAVLTGSFVAPRPVAIFFVVAVDFENFSEQGPARYDCSFSPGCFTSGNVTSGEANFTLPEYANGTGVPFPWVLVMVNANATEATNLTWTSQLVASYIVIEAGAPAYPGP